ncbi:hypothetical protein GCM10017083_40510 [Thalassobaculum fulvum]|uniref:Uncharacterized protein n=1 Tax=Thalassobaculum fulvum TaxID=1633335 RepID=A0A919CR51_9PROT|nr:hypothetical protein GCM10017083_40510 [Thalassobaculum fulvum]
MPSSVPLPLKTIARPRTFSTYCAVTRPPSVWHAIAPHSGRPRCIGDHATESARKTAPQESAVSPCRVLAVDATLAVPVDYDDDVKDTGARVFLSVMK